MKDSDTDQAHAERDVEKSNTLHETERQRALGNSVIHAAFTAASSHEASIGDTAEMREVTNDEDVYDPFGDEESYWTIYRIFASQKNLGRLWGLEDIWDYLLNIYDMSLETLVTLEETLMEWREDIEADAANRGIKGTFMKYGESYVFAELITSVPTRSISDKFSENDVPRKAAPKHVTSTKVEVATALQSVEYDIKGVLDSSLDGAVKQAEIKKYLVRDKGELSQEELQNYIDELVRKGRIYKFRRGAAAYLALEPHETGHLPILELDKEDGNEKEIFDSETSVAILRVLCEPGSHYERKQTLKHLWVSINRGEGNRITEEGLGQLKKASRQLMRMGLVTAGGEKMGTGGVRTKSATSSKRRRSATRHVYKVGLLSQDVKEEIQKVLEGKNPDDYLRQRFFELTV